MSNEPTIRAAIKTAIESVNNVGVVYDYLRYASEWDKFLALFKIKTGPFQGAIRGWMITCTGFDPIQERQTYGDIFNRDYSYDITGYFGLSDDRATEKEAFAIVEEVIDALCAQVDGGEDNVPTLTMFEPRLFGGVVCHVAQIKMSVKGEVNP